ncbi:hypothetical protein V2H45_19370 [Tumidithrix elongata RA019]|uniref:DUF3862 domain-containing protein n=1 Tax=Tumidithrix elongata BACA0141 TaxID=2716417 RepID=A0AAW9Q2W2_9CYAN|nr:hypothetical protein [Tumidithrix elongata RA019]
MPQLPTAELAQQGDAKAIAELLSKSLLPYDIAVDANLMDGCLLLHLISIQVMDQVKLMALIKAELDPLRIESITKVKVHGWREDPVIHERRLFWTEQFKLEPPEKSSPKSEIAAQQPSEESTFNQVIHEIAQKREVSSDVTSGDRAKIDRSDLASTSDTLTRDAIASHALSESTPVSGTSSKSGTWQLLLLGLSIVILGLAIGVVIRVFTAKSNSSPPAPLTDTSPTPPVQASPSPGTAVTPDANQTTEVKITLDKFKQIKDGMTLQQVTDIIGSQGKLIAESKLGDSTGQVYSWKNPQGSNAIIEFKNGRVVAKAQAGL